MHTFKVFSVAAALGAGFATASTCKSLKITSANQAIDCDVVKGDVTVDSSLGGDVVINGPKQIMGDLKITNATQLLSISSTTINAVGGTFTMDSLNLLSSLSMTSLRSVNNLAVNRLPQLSSFMFGSEGVTKVDQVSITDTFINNLSGLNLATVDTFTISNNRQLTSFDSDLVNITGTLSISYNGNNFAINMSKLESAQSIQLSNIKSLSAPSLKEMDGSLSFTANPSLVSFSAPQLTLIKQGLSFIDNKLLKNVTFAKLTKIGGGLKIYNNAAMTTVDGFPKLTNVAGALNMSGSFEEASLPDLTGIQGTADIISTTKNTSLCEYFDKLRSDEVIKAQENCEDDHEDDSGSSGGGSSDDGSDGSDSGSSSDSTDGDSLAALNHVNFALLGLAGVAAFAQLM